MVKATDKIIFSSSDTVSSVPVKKKRKYDSESARRTRIENRRRALLGLPKLRRQRVTNRPYTFSGKYRGKNGVEKRKFKKHFLDDAVATKKDDKKNLFVDTKQHVEAKRSQKSRLAPISGTVPAKIERMAPVEV